MARVLKSIALLSAAATAVQPMLAAEQQVGLHAWTVHHENVLGTSMELTVRAASHEVAEHAEAAVLRSIDADNKILSAWDAKSELSRWMRTRGEAVPVSVQLMDVLATYERWRAETNGALDASAETAVRLWKNSTAEGRVPTDSEITHAKLAMQQEHWVLDREHGTATHLTDTPLALASFTKSYITQRAAEAALAAGASGVTLNVGGDVVVRGDATQVVEIVDPHAHAENEKAMDEVVVRDRCVATSGSYRRGFTRSMPLHLPGVPEYQHQGTEYPPFTGFEYSHIVDPRTAQPVGHIASATVIAQDATTAGALATAFSVLSESETAKLAARHPGVEYLLITRGGRRIASPHWNTYSNGTVAPAAYVVPAASPKPAANAGAWNQNFELVIGVELARISSPRYRRPYVAVWIEDKDHFPVRTLALWYDNKQRWLPELKNWYRENQIRTMAEGTDITRTVSSATRMPGTYTLKWDGKDNEGKLVKAGTYTVNIEIAREHGGTELLRRTMDFNGQPQQQKLAGNEEGSATLDYRKR